MDPQACLARLIELVELLNNEGLTAKERKEYQAQRQQVFADLADWLKKGGFAPVAAGPIFGTIFDRRERVGKEVYFKEIPIRVVPDVDRRQPRYTLETKSYSDPACPAWRLVEFNEHGDELRSWDLRTE